jgi:hypothetical protein
MIESGNKRSESGGLRLQPTTYGRKPAVGLWTSGRGAEFRNSPRALAYVHESVAGDSIKKAQIV